MASTSDEIREVFESDIYEKSRVVRQKYGELPFYDGLKNMRIFRLIDADPCDTDVPEKEK